MKQEIFPKLHELFFIHPILQLSRFDTTYTFSLNHLQPAGTITIIIFSDLPDLYVVEN